MYCRFTDKPTTFTAFFLGSSTSTFHSDLTRLNNSIEARASSTESCSPVWMRRPIQIHKHNVYHRLELEEPILKILYGAKTVSTRSAITPPKVNKFGRNLEKLEPNVGLALADFCRHLNKLKNRQSLNHTNIDIQAMLVRLTLLPYDFCGFRSVAVNSVYKPVFTFIGDYAPFTYLLTYLSRSLRSSDKQLLSRPYTSLVMADKTFSVRAPNICSNLLLTAVLNVTLNANFFHRVC